MNLPIGSLVRNPRAPALDLGKVLRVRGDKSDVFFAGQDGIEALTMRTGALVLAEVQVHPWLDNLPPFAEVGGKLRLQEGRLTQAQALAKFKAYFPEAFNDLVYLADGENGERSYKVQAHDLWTELLGADQLRTLLAAGDISELTRRAQRVEGRLNLLFTNERIALRNALQDATAAQRFFAALLEVLEAPAPDEGTFTAFVKAVDALPEKGGRICTWPIVTLFPYIAQPDRHMFLKPEVTKQAEQRMAFHLNYQPHPNWRTYKCLLELSGLLLQELRPLGARDMIDIQSFIWVTAAYEPKRSAG
jgi:hypothetical protein